MDPHLSKIEKQLSRVEEKVDMIIRYFNIGKTLDQSRKEIEKMADKVIFDLEKKRKGRCQAKKNSQSS